MIAIVNTGPHDDPNPLGERTYEVRINSKVITTFRHKRGDGLGQCLLAASKAVEKQKWEPLMDCQSLTRCLTGYEPSGPASVYLANAVITNADDGSATKDPHQSAFGA